MIKRVIWSWLQYHKVHWFRNERKSKKKIDVAEAPPFVMTASCKSDSHTTSLDRAVMEQCFSVPHAQPDPGVASVLPYAEHP